MPDYKSPRFKKPFNKGGPRRDDFSPGKRYPATCNNCRAACEVPFRPNGMKPVFCRDCFKPENDRAERPSFNSRPSFEKRPFTKERSDFAPRPAAPDRRIDDLKRQLDGIEAKLDSLAALIGQSHAATAPAPKAVKKAAPKKRATKKA